MLYGEEVSQGLLPLPHVKTTKVHVLSSLPLRNEALARQPGDCENRLVRAFLLHHDFHFCLTTVQSQEGSLDIAQLHANARTAKVTADNRGRISQ